jgi:hypothetical protein
MKAKQEKKLWFVSFVRKDEEHHGVLLTKYAVLAESKIKAVKLARAVDFGATGPVFNIEEAVFGVAMIR